MNSDILCNLIITKVNSVSVMYTEGNTKTKRTDRPSWALVLKYEGETLYNDGKKVIKSDSNNMVILPKGCSYEWKCTKSGHFTIIEFEADSVYDEIFSFPIKNTDKILNIFNRLEYKRTLKSPFSELESIRDVYSIILLLLQASNTKYMPAQKHKKLSNAVDYIIKNYNKEIRNDELARLCGFSTVYFRKLFTEAFGVSPISYIHELRIKKAKEMLKSDHGNITDIALSLGYANIYDFSRDFKKRTGISPSKF